MKYRQIAHKLRIERPGHPHRESMRPRAGQRGDWREFLDSDDNPTLVEFYADDRVDIPALLRQGAIVEWTPPKRPKAVSSGEKSG